MRRPLAAAILIVSAALILRGAQAPSKPAESSAPAEAIRLNNLGAASMNQQKFEQGLQWFEKAAAADPALAVARVNKAIALINLQRYDPARDLLVQATTADPKDARAWYNLGLLQKSTGDAEASLASFDKVVAIRPADAHSQYLVGLMAAQIQQYDKAVAAFTRALEIDPFLVSAEFGLARAFQRAGRGDEAKTHLDRFQRLTTEKIASAMSLGYGDQGPLSLAEPLLPKAGAAPPAIPVKFVAEGQSPFAAAIAGGATSSGFGVGGCLFDADGDGIVDYLALNPHADAKPGDAAVLFRGAAGGSFERIAQSGLVVPGRPIACAAADYDNDEKPDLAISTASGVFLFHNEGSGRFSNTTEKTGLLEPAFAAGSAPLGVTWVDYDHDNDVDLIIPCGDFAAVPGASFQVPTNTASTPAPGMPVPAPPAPGMPVPAPPAPGMPVPAPPAPGTPNPAPGTRHPEPGTLNPEPGTRNPNPGTRHPAPGTAPSSPSLPRLAQQRQRHLHRRLRRTRLRRQRGQRGRGRHRLQQQSRDRSRRDRRAEALALHQPARRRVQDAGLAGHVRGADGGRGGRRFRQGRLDGSGVHPCRRARPVRVAQRPGHARRAGGAAEPEARPGLGRRADRLRQRRMGRPGRGCGTQLRCRGARRPAQRSGPIRGCLERGRRVHAPDQGRPRGARGGSRRRRRCRSGRHDRRRRPPRGAERGRQREPVPAAHLEGPERQPQRRRHEGRSAGWCELAEVGDGRGVGLPRTERARARRRSRRGDAGRRRAPAVAERRRAGRGGARRGEAAGHRADRSPRQLVPDRLHLERHALRVHHRRHRPGRRRALGRARRAQRARSGRVHQDCRHAAAAQERPSLGQVRGADGGSDLPRSGAPVRDRSPGRLGRVPAQPAAIAPQPPAEVFVTRGARLPAGAWDDTGRDVLPLLRARDQRYVEGFGSGGFKGFAALHALELDLGDLPPGGPVRLLMTGFTDYFTATSVFAARQANVTAIVPYLEARLADGTWKKVSDDIGFPAGLRRTMTADITRLLPQGTRRIRIWTNLKVYWDQVLIDTTPAGAVPSLRTEAPLAEAALAYRGFPREVPGTPAADLTYMYDQVSQYGPYARHRGFYTRYGDVGPLVSAIDDRFTIFGAGDEVSLEFDATALPLVRDGWTRDYLLFIDGYVKDMDFYAAHAQTVAPLPFRDMKTYPYPANVRYPDRNRDYLLEWNTREVGAEGWPTYRFEFRTR